MQSTQNQKQETSAASPSEGSDKPALGLADIELKFEEKDFPHFFVEYTEIGKDLIYHFWPPGKDLEFCRGFAVCLERGFVATVAPDTVVKANYTDLREARVLHTEGVGTLVPKREAHDKTVQPRETFHIRVVNGTENPMADTFLKGRLFDNIEKAINQGI